MICVDRFGDLSDGHQAQKLRNYLVEKVESQFGRPLTERLKKYSDEIEKDSKENVNLKNRKFSKSLETKVFAQQDKELVDEV